MYNEISLTFFTKSESNGFQGKKYIDFSKQENKIVFKSRILTLKQIHQLIDGRLYKLIIVKTPLIEF